MKFEYTIRILEARWITMGLDIREYTADEKLTINNKISELKQAVKILKESENK